MSLSKVAILCMNPWRAPGAFQPLSYGAYRIAAALTADSDLEGLDVRIFESGDWSAAEWVERVETFDPDVVGGSVYVWGLPTFVEVTRRLKANSPGRTVVLGGPSARPANLMLEPYRGCSEWIDALVLHDGEDSIRELVKCHGRDRETLQQIDGLALPHGDGWQRTSPREPIRDLDRLPSPFELGLVPPDVTGSVETSRGCAMSCSYCQWGSWTGGARARSPESLAAELRALARSRSSGVYLLDAGFNLNQRAFRALAAAEEAVGFIRSTEMLCEVYPSRLKPEHLQFLDSTRAFVGLGLQSLNSEVLRQLGRPAHPSDLDHTVGQLAEVAQTTIEIIMGLPGDRPESFVRTLEAVRQMPCSVRVYHCMALPDALMDGAPDEYKLQFDPITLEIRSCLGWSEAELEKMTRRLTQEATDAGGIHSRVWPDPAPLRPDEHELGKPVGVSLWMFPNHEHESQHRHRESNKPRDVSGRSSRGSQPDSPQDAATTAPTRPLRR